VLIPNPYGVGGEAKGNVRRMCFSPNPFFKKFMKSHIIKTTQKRKKKKKKGRKRKLKLTCFG
jgi:hypothetical protein